MNTLDRLQYGGPPLGTNTIDLRTLRELTRGGEGGSSASSEFCTCRTKQGPWHCRVLYVQTKQQWSQIKGGHNTALVPNKSTEQNRTFYSMATLDFCMCSDLILICPMYGFSSQKKSSCYSQR